MLGNGLAVMKGTEKSAGRGKKFLCVGRVPERAAKIAAAG